MPKFFLDQYLRGSWTWSDKNQVPISLEIYPLDLPAKSFGILDLQASLTHAILAMANGDQENYRICENSKCNLFFQVRHTYLTKYLKCFHRENMSTFK